MPTAEATPLDAASQTELGTATADVTAAAAPSAHEVEAQAAPAEATATPAAGEGATPAVVGPQLIPTGEPNRRIVKPRHVLEAEAKPPEPTPRRRRRRGRTRLMLRTRRLHRRGHRDHGTRAARSDAADVCASGRPRARRAFVGLVHNDGVRGGLVVLTHHPHRASKAKLLANTALKEKKLIEGLVTGVVKGGVEVDIEGLRAFAPGSHIDLRLGTDLHRFVGKRL